MTPDAQSPAVVAYDGSESARAALDVVARLFPDRPAIVVAVWEPLARVAAAGSIAVPAGLARQAAEALDAEAQREAAGHAEDGAERLGGHGIAASASSVVAEGNVWATLVAVAEDNDAAVVVVGSRGQSAVRSALLGSVSLGVVQHSSRPVLVVHGDGAAA